MFQECESNEKKVTPGQECDVPKALRGGGMGSSVLVFEGLCFRNTRHTCKGCPTVSKQKFFDLRLSGQILWVNISDRRAFSLFETVPGSVITKIMFSRVNNIAISVCTSLIRIRESRSLVSRTLYPFPTRKVCARLGSHMQAREIRPSQNQNNF